jgi:hypothetical protein
VAQRQAGTRAKSGRYICELLAFAFNPVSVRGSSCPPTVELDRQSVSSRALLLPSMLPLPSLINSHLQYRFNSEPDTSVYDLFVSYRGASVEPRFTLRAFADVPIELIDGPPPLLYSRSVSSTLRPIAEPLLTLLELIATRELDREERWRQSHLRELPQQPPVPGRPLASSRTTESSRRAHHLLRYLEGRARKRQAFAEQGRADRRVSGHYHALPVIRLNPRF